MMMTAQEISDLADALYVPPEPDGTAATLAEHYRLMYMRERYKACAYEAFWESDRRLAQDRADLLERHERMRRQLSAPPLADMGCVDPDDEDTVDEVETGDPVAVDLEAYDFGQMPNIKTDATDHNWASSTPR